MEPYLPIPPPEEGWQDVSAALCGDCGCILQNVRYVGLVQMGWCQDHGLVPTYYRNWKLPVSDET